MMTNTLFLQSDVADPYAVYAGMRAKHPVYYDEVNRIWAIYTYSHCKHVLEASSAHIPGQNAAWMPLLNAPSSTLIANFARLANPPQHAPRREAVMRLLGCMQRVDIEQLLAQLIGQLEEFDWVSTVCKKLPVLAVMKAFGFADGDLDAMPSKIERLTKIMLPNKTPAQIEDINVVAEDIHAMFAAHLARAFPALADTTEARLLHASNLVGLLVQSVDAGRGILSNALLQALPMQHCASGETWQRVVVETLRFDPPIQNTRRVLTRDLELGGQGLPKGSTVLIVLASANRDEDIFPHAERFDADRSNNGAHLTFGAGAHACAAHHFAAALATDTLAALFKQGRRFDLQQQDIDYEPMVNARLPKQILLRYSS